MYIAFFKDFYAKSPVTFVLSILVLLFSLLALANRKFLLAFMLHPVSMVKQHQYYRIFTADFVNADFLHLVLNEFVLYAFCSDLEETLRQRNHTGSIIFALVYWGSLLFASAAVTLRHYKDFDYSTTGTSGSIMGCMFALMIIAPNDTVYDLPFIGGVKNIYGGLIYIIMLIIYQWKKKEDFANHEFHFFGALGGALIALVCRKII